MLYVYHNPKVDASGVILTIVVPSDVKSTEFEVDKVTALKSLETANPDNILNLDSSGLKNIIISDKVKFTKAKAPGAWRQRQHNEQCSRR